MSRTEGYYWARFPREPSGKNEWQTVPRVVHVTRRPEDGALVVFLPGLSYAYRQDEFEFLSDRLAQPT
jgi:hypothetical protein